MSIKIGDTIPAATLRRLTADGIEEVKSHEFCYDRKVVIFALPGAFTPPCSNEHMPSFIENADAIKAKGVDEIACIAVNDPFVMDAWNKATGAEGKVTLLSDGNCEFTKEIGMDFEGLGLGFGTRSKRYAMVVENGKVTALEVEESPGECTVSSGSKLLESLT